jgi:hypothetical protein
VNHRHGSRILPSHASPREIILSPPAYWLAHGLYHCNKVIWATGSSPEQGAESRLTGFTTIPPGKVEGELQAVCQGPANGVPPNAG